MKIKLVFALKLYIKGLTCETHLNSPECRARFALILVWYIFVDGPVARSLALDTMVSVMDTGER